MGSSEAALNLVLEEEENIDWAIKICKEHADPDLWKLLIKHSLDKPGKAVFVRSNRNTKA